VKLKLALTLMAFTVAITPLFAEGTPNEEGYKYYAHKISNPKDADDFTLIDQDGKPFSLHSLRGKFALIDFGFTACPNICPTTLANLAATYALLSPKEQARLQILFITIDPARDTAKVLKKYVPFFEKSFIGLTGKANKIDATARAYGVQYEDETKRTAGSRDYVVAHSAAIFLIGPSGKCLGFYGNNDLRDNKRMAEDLRHFLALSPVDNDNWESQKGGVVKPLPVSGRQLYLEQCASCHLENGRGISGKYPSLVESARVIGPPNRLSALVLDGVEGNVDPGNTRPSGVMPAWRTVLPPSYVAQILTYIRQAWGNAAPGISGPYVEKIFYQSASRSHFWSWKELDALPPDTNADEASPGPKSSAVP
jgi:protein SCO1/2